MGCFNSKSTADKGAKGSKQQQAKPKAGKTDASKPKNNEPTASEPETKKKESTVKENPAESFLKSVLSSAEKFFNSLPDSDAMKQVVALTFVNSCIEVTRNKFRLKFEAVVDLMTSQTKNLPLLNGRLSKAEERSMDDGFSRILLAWASNNASFTAKIPAKSGQAILDALYIRYTLSDQASFEDILRLQFRWVSVNQAALEVFSKFSEGKDVMTPEQLGKFLRETQRVDDITDRHITEKYKYRFGGGVHRYNFASYTGSVLTNNVVDPGCTSDVWQDMTQSFTHYLIGCTRVSSEQDMNRALSEGSYRTFILDLKKNKSGQICTGSCPLQTLLDNIKKNGFTHSTYPIVLCISPSTTVPIEVQDETAKLITDTLGSMIAKGLMFEGAAISDPKFSPGALRKKVLIAGFQSPLKPFVGFLVADMNKDGLGVRVTDVVEGTPAAKGGVLKDDWLTHIDDVAIKNKAHLRERLSKLKVGQEVKVKRENLDELTIVVGGTVDPQDRSVSPALSGLVFFRFTKDEKDTKPWDTLCIESSKLQSCTQNRTSLSAHFAFVSIGGDPDSIPALIGKASVMGVQFVDADQSELSLAWNRGRFYDNGRCGYLLKTNLEGEKFPELNIEVICGPRAVSCAPMTGGSVKLFGAGLAHLSGTCVSFSGYNEATVAVLEMTFELNGEEHTFVASFGLSLIRQGYRALPCLGQDEEKMLPRRIHGVYLFVKNI